VIRASRGDGVAVTWLRHRAIRLVSKERRAMKLSKALKLSVIGTVIGIPAAWATTLAVQEHSIVQKDKAFSTAEMTVKVGDSIKFTNEDSIVHNVFSATPGLEFDLRTQQPGGSSVVPFAKEGVCEVRCAIHPKMKLKVTVQK
jgi:plastocyanin